MYFFNETKFFVTLTESECRESITFVFLPHLKQNISRRGGKIDR